MSDIAQAIDDYQKDILTRAFIADLESLLKKAHEKKNSERSDETRHWAVVHTDLEKTLAYAKSYLGV